jgi:hypothetical protein
VFNPRIDGRQLFPFDLQLPGNPSNSWSMEPISRRRLLLMAPVLSALLAVVNKAGAGAINSRETFVLQPVLCDRDRDHRSHELADQQTSCPLVN